MVANLVETFDQVRRTDAVADPCARHAIGFGEGAHANDPRIVCVDVWCGAARCKLDIGFIQKQKCSVRERVERFFDFRAAVPAAHRVVGVRQIDDFGFDLGRLGDQCVYVFVIVAERHFVQRAAKTHDVIVEGGVGAV